MKKEINIGSDFSGAGAFDFAVNGIAEEKGWEVINQFACDSDKHVQEIYLTNHESPKIYWHDVYDRRVPTKCLDIYMTSPPCQAFSISGNRLGKEDERGVLFFNSLEFIRINKPRTFIFENVEGLHSHDEGRTFREWINYLGGKSVNGAPTIFPYDEAVPYHLYWKLINAKEHGLPQNRRRLFLVGIRDDEMNNFTFPPEEHLTTSLKDLLEEDIDRKYYDLPPSCAENIFFHSKDGKEYAPENSYKIRSAVDKGFEIAKLYDSVTYQQPKSKTRRGRVGKGIAQTLDCSGQQGVIVSDGLRRFTPRECFRLMGYKEDFKLTVSDNQLYKIAGNSICINPLRKIIAKFNFHGKM